MLAVPGSSTNQNTESFPIVNSVTESLEVNSILLSELYVRVLLSQLMLQVFHLKCLSMELIGLKLEFTSTTIMNLRSVTFIQTQDLRVEELKSDYLEMSSLTILSPKNSCVDLSSLMDLSLQRNSQPDMRTPLQSFAFPLEVGEQEMRLTSN